MPKKIKSICEIYVFSCLEFVSLFSKVLFWVLWQKFNDCSQLLCHCDLRLNYYVQHCSFFFHLFFFFLMFVITQTQSTATEKSNKNYSFSGINYVAATYFHWMNSHLFYFITHFWLRFSIFFLNFIFLLQWFFEQ